MERERELSVAWTGFTRSILLYESHVTDTHGPGGDLRGNEQPLVQMMYGQICGSKCLMQPKWKENKDGLSRNQNLTMSGIIFIEPHNEEFKLTMKAAHRKLEVPVPAAMPCKISIKCSGKSTPVLGNARLHTLVLLMPTTARDQGLKELGTNLLKITSLQKEWIL